MERMSKKVIATSKPFKFLVGPDQTEYTIHSALVAHQSSVLSAMVNGSFRESSEYCVKWGNIEEIVFDSFWQFVYTGDYDNPEPFPPTAVTLEEEEPKPDDSKQPPALPVLHEPSEDEPIEEAAIEEPIAVAEEPTTELEALPEALPDDIPSPPAKKEMKKKSAVVRETSLWVDFLFSWDYPSELLDFDVTLRDFANPLVHHAKVYTLADRYAVTRLMTISHKKLDRSLTDHHISKEANSDVVELVRYTFEELVPDRLRDLVVHYIACVVEHLWKLEEFQELVGTHSFLSKALLGTMLLRLD
ncbi:btb/poz fold protein [Fusarium sporotrichioides]|uniref:Btb/poz fold protein n=1 Tax=Fusarium sporotrichioides TaxID=5514 RepID=A0A395RQZ2_FUSSP|nr:btb/poz fold protein [Fusarium sporotrichioides]